jgi:uroporphyrin-III C-methyltransferase
MLPTLYQHLSSSGLSPNTPSVAVERGTTIDQRIVFAPLHELSRRAHQAGLKSPTLIIIGEVIREEGLSV